MSFRTHVSSAHRVLKTEGIWHFLKEFSIVVESALGSLPLVRWVCLWLSIRELQMHRENEQTLEDIVSTTTQYRGFGPYRSIEPLQITEELVKFTELIYESNPTTVVEIGTGKGGTLYVLSQYVDTASTIISIDLPGGDFGGIHSHGRVPLFQRFSRETDMHFVRNDSHDEETKETVAQLLSGDSIDVLFIDGDHTYEGVTQDFEMYRPLVAEDGLVAFHDIVENPYHKQCQVPQFWEEISSEYNTTEIVADRDQEWGGIGVIHDP